LAECVFSIMLDKDLPSLGQSFYLKVMSNPQLENGHLRIANEIWDALCRIRIRGEANQVLNFIIRKTYGYNKKWDRISLSQFASGTGICKQSICRAIKILIEMKLINQKATPNGSMYKFNKNIDEWKPLTKKRQGVAKRLKGGRLLVKRGVAKKRHTKDNITKDNIQKTICRDKNPDHPKFIKYYCDKYKETFKTKFAFDGGKDAKIIKTLLKQFDYDMLCEMALLFFKDDSEFVKGHTIGKFKFQSQALAEELKNPKISKEQKLIEEVSKEYDRRQKGNIY